MPLSPTPPSLPCQSVVLHGAPLTVELCQSTDTGFHEGVAFVRQRYWRYYGAHARVTAPHLIILRDPTGGCRAVAGLTPASDKPLFLEQYLDQPVEALATRQAGTTIDRNKIWEIANLAADGSGAGRMLFVALTARLASLGGEWVAFTATTQVRNMFNRLGLSPVSVADADPERLGDGALCWGRYYQHNPKVMLGHVPPGHRYLIQQGWLKNQENHNDVVA